MLLWRLSLSHRNLTVKQAHISFGDKSPQQFRFLLLGINQQENPVEENKQIMTERTWATGEPCWPSPPSHPVLTSSFHSPHHRSFTISRGQDHHLGPGTAAGPRPVRSGSSSQPPMSYQVPFYGWRRSVCQTSKQLLFQAPETPKGPFPKGEQPGERAGMAGTAGSPRCFLFRRDPGFTEALLC